MGPLEASTRVSAFEDVWEDVVLTNTRVSARVSSLRVRCPPTSRTLAVSEAALRPQPSRQDGADPAARPGVTHTQQHTQRNKSGSAPAGGGGGGTGSSLAPPPGAAGADWRQPRGRRRRRFSDSHRVGNAAWCPAWWRPQRPGGSLSGVRFPGGGGSARRSPEGGRFSAAGRGRPRGRAAPGCVPPGSAARRPNRPPAPRFPAPSRGAHPGTPRPPLAGLSVGGQEPSPTLSLGGGAAFTARGWCRRVRRRTGLTFLRAHVRPTFPQEPREWERDAGRWAGLSRPAAPGSGCSGRQQSGLGTSGLS